SLHTHTWTFPTSLVSLPVRAQRTQVKNACTNCQKAHKKCDQSRPCQRCTSYGVDGCISSQKKDRTKGKTRGPYKKRKWKG
ncbi:hypothetical protein B0H16DRAFT_1221500, partial [Mycena metata]